jgi:hypothetical protein
MMLDRNGLIPLILEALQANGGSARIHEIGKYVWDNHQTDLRNAGNLFYKWQYELRWASDQLAHEGKIRKGPPRGTWHLAD